MNLKLLKGMKKNAVFNNSVNGEDFLAFLFGLRDSFITILKGLDGKEVKYLLERAILHLRKTLGLKLHYRVFYFESLVEEGIVIVLSKKKIPKNISEWLMKDHYKTGIYLGYPKCCVKKFCKEINEHTKGNFSKDASMRYKEQLKELKIKKDVFDVDIKYQGRFGFVPCHPKCPNALKFYKKYKDIVKTYKKIKLL